MQGKNERLRMRRERGLKKGGCFFRESQKCSSHESLSSFGARRFPKRRAKSPLVRPQTHTRCPGRGLTRRLRRGSGTWRPMGRSHFSFGGERKVCKRKPAARHYGKKASTAHFDGGARNVARDLVGQITPTLGARSCSPFSAVKMGGPFSLRCLTPLCFPAVGAGQAQRNASWDVSAEIGWLRSAKKRASFFLYNWHCTYSTNGAGMIRCCLDIFATQKASVISYPRWPFMRAMRPVAEWRPFLFNWRFTTPDPRAVAPVVPRR